MNIVYFLGRLHVVVLHLPIGIVLVTLLVEWLARRDRFRALAPLTPVLWWAAAATAIVTAMLGLLHAQESAGGPAVAWHRAFGLTFAGAVVLASVLRQWRPKAYGLAHVPIAVAMLVLVTLTGHYGGNITHGSSFLVEYAPEPLRRLAGVETRRAIVTDPAKADAYVDVVQPVFDAHCTSCHNDDRKKGGLSLVSRARLMAGGRDGVVVVAGNVAASEIYRRVTLPADDEHAMPAEGKPRLSEHDKKIIEWWIAAGAPENQTVAQVGALPASAEIATTSAGGMKDIGGAVDTRAVIAARDAPGSGDVSGAGGAPGTGASSTAASAGLTATRSVASAPSVPPASPESLAKLTALGFVIRPVAQGSPLLDVAFVKGQHIDPARFDSLLEIKDQVVDLNLRAAGLTDAQLRVIGQLTNLEHLRIELNDITDAGIQNLAGLDALRSLNLYGTRVTDASIVTLAHLKSLRDVYLFRTAVTDTAVSRSTNERLALHKS